MHELNKVKVKIRTDLIKRLPWLYDNCEYPEVNKVLQRVLDLISDLEEDSSEKVYRQKRL